MFRTISRTALIAAIGGAGIFALSSIASSVTPVTSGNSGYETYCTAKLSGNGCLATMTGSSTSQPVSGANDWSVVMSHAQASVPVIVYTSLSGKADLPFLAGSATLCVQPPLKRANVLFSFGTLGGCDGSVELLINTGATYPGFDPGPGGTSYIQAWMRDILVSPIYVLSDAVQVNWAP